MLTRGTARRKIDGVTDAVNYVVIECSYDTPDGTFVCE